MTAANATTVKLVNDFRLVDQARIVLVARVAGTLPAPELDRPVTDYLMTVERVLKGSVGESSILVRVPGGRASDGMELKIWGAPKFVDGERALLFLGRHADGSYRILHLMLGAFREARMDGHAIAYRDFSEVDLLDDTEAVADETRKVRDFDLFADWIADRADSRLQVPNYYRFLPGESQNSLLPMFTLLEENGRHTRWFQFDSGGQVSWKIDPDPLAGFSGSPADAFRAALGAWNAESHTPIRLTFSGTSGATAGFTSFDSQNVLLFEDPNGDIEGDFTCASGGTLAIGGPWYDTDVHRPVERRDLLSRPGRRCRPERRHRLLLRPTTLARPRPSRSSSGTRSATPSDWATRARTPAKPTRRCAMPSCTSASTTTGAEPVWRATTSPVCGGSTTGRRPAAAAAATADARRIPSAW